MFQVEEEEEEEYKNKERESDKIDQSMNSKRRELTLRALFPLKEHSLNEALPY